MEGIGDNDPNMLHSLFKFWFKRAWIAIFEVPTAKWNENQRDISDSLYILYL